MGYLWSNHKQTGTGRSWLHSSLNAWSAYDLCSNLDIEVSRLTECAALQSRRHQMQWHLMASCLRVSVSESGGPMTTTLQLQPPLAPVCPTRHSIWLPLGCKEVEWAVRYGLRVFTQGFSYSVFSHASLCAERKCCQTAQPSPQLDCYSAAI